METQDTSEGMSAVLGGGAHKKYHKKYHKKLYLPNHLQTHQQTTPLISRLPLPLRRRISILLILQKTIQIKIIQIKRIQ